MMQPIGSIDFELSQIRQNLITQLKSVWDGSEVSKVAVVETYRNLSGANKREAKKFCEENIFNED